MAAQMTYIVWVTFQHFMLGSTIKRMSCDDDDDDDDDDVGNGKHVIMRLAVRLIEGITMNRMMIVVMPILSFLIPRNCPISFTVEPLLRLIFLFCPSLPAKEEW